MNRTKEYWTLYCSILARVHRRNQSILFIHGVIYFFADIFLHSPAYLTDRLEFFYITSHDVYFNVYTQCTSFFIKPDPHVTFWYIAVTKFILTIHADRGTVKYYNRVLPSVKNQLHPRLFFLNMWAHLKTKGPQNSSQWTLAYQRAVTDSSKPLLCHYVVLQTIPISWLGWSTRKTGSGYIQKALTPSCYVTTYDDTLQR